MHEAPTLPVRVGVPPKAGLAWAAWAPTAALAITEDDEPWVSVSRVPATVSTLPAMPLGNLGVLTGMATCEPLLVTYTDHFVPKCFCALPIVIVAVARRWVTSIVAVTPNDLKALTTALRADDGAP